MKSRTTNDIEAFLRLAPFAEVGSLLCRLAGDGQLNTPKALQEICTLAGLAQARASEAERTLEAGRAAGLFSRISETRWCATNTEVASRLAPLLEGVDLYKTRVHRDENLVDLVLTKPSAPSRMADELERSLSGSWGIRDTLELLPAIAESANAMFTVVSPFLDQMGADVVANLFARTRAAERCLILRTASNGEPPPGLQEVRARLDDLGVAILNFRLERPEATGFETFHAKVILADDQSAYLGSANMQRWSFEYSLELGFYVRGKAAARLADVVAAIRAVSSPMVEA